MSEIKLCVCHRHPNGASFVHVEKVVPCKVSFIDAFKNKYGQDCDPKIDQEISAIMKQSKMSSFELVGMHKVQKKQALVADFSLYYCCHMSWKTRIVTGFLDWCPCLPQYVIRMTQCSS